MISVSVGGSTAKLESFLRSMQKLDMLSILRANGKKGVTALANATPQDSGLAAASWGYQVSAKNGVYTISWTNSDNEGGFPVAIMLQYGYATGTGGYVQGRDYINPAIEPIFTEIAVDVWKAVTSA